MEGLNRERIVRLFYGNRYYGEGFVFRCQFSHDPRYNYYGNPLLRAIGQSYLEFAREKGMSETELYYEFCRYRGVPRFIARRWLAYNLYNNPGCNPIAGLGLSLNPPYVRDEEPYPPPGLHATIPNELEIDLVSLHDRKICRDTYVELIECRETDPIEIPEKYDLEVIQSSVRGAVMVRCTLFDILMVNLDWTLL